MLPTSNGKGSNDEPVQVIVRIRPELAGDGSPPVVVARDQRSVALLPLPAPPPDPNGKTKLSTEKKTFTFDKVFYPHATQAALYDFARPLVTSAVDGYNSTIFAYGHTGSGKTHTMMGTPAQPGMTPRAVQDMFDLIRRMAAREQDTIFIVRMSYVELYNNQFRNLLEGTHGIGDDGGHTGVGFGSSVGSERGGWAGGEATSEGSLRSSWRSLNGSLASSMNGGGGLASRSYDGSLASLAATNKGSNRTAVAARSGKIEVRESPEAGVFLSGPGLRRAVTSAQEALRLVARGDAVRATAATDCNEHSSRSHSILSFHVESQRVNLAGGTGIGGGRGGAKGTGGSGVRLGKLHLVDLAGSERLSLSGSEGKRLHETQNINLSLSSLGDVLACLSRNATIIARRSSSSESNPGRGAGETVSPVPYRNSKLTHFLKDSLGGNSKTLMVTALRSTVAYHRQSLVSLLYASRAKKIRNQSCVNVDTAGQSNIHQVSAEIETLRTRLQQRSAELSHLNASHETGRAENAALRDRLQGLSATNQRERAQLEGKLSTVIHSQAGKLAEQHQAFVTLQGRLQGQLGEYQKKCMMQQEEIHHLKSTIQSLEKRDDEERVGSEEVAEMQRVVAAWQSQATEAQEELRLASKEMEGVRSEGLAHRKNAGRTNAELKAAEAREKTLLGYWRQLQGVLSLGTTSPMPAEGVISAVHRLREERKAEADARVEAERARAGVEKAARALAGGAGECRDLERRVADLVSEKERMKSTVLEMETGNTKAAERLERLNASRAKIETSIAEEEAKQKAATKRLSNVEAALGRSLELKGLRAALDEATAGRAAAHEQAASSRRELQGVMTSRDDALRANEEMRGRLKDFEGTLRGVSEETLVVLEKKEAVLQRVEAERKEERESRDKEAQELRLLLESSRAESARLETEVARAKATAKTERHNSASAKSEAAGAAVAESAAKARVAVAIGARHDAEKKAAAAREKVKGMEQSFANEREASARQLHKVELDSSELRRRLHDVEEDLKSEAARSETKLEELIQQKDETARELLRQQEHTHKSELAAEKKRAQQALKNALSAADREIRQENAEAMAALSQEKDEALRRELDANQLELQQGLSKAAATAEAQGKAAEARAAEMERARGARERQAIETKVMELQEQLSAAKLSEQTSSAKLSEQLSTSATLSAEKLEAAELAAAETARALETAEEKLRALEGDKASAIDEMQERLTRNKREAQQEHDKLLQDAAADAEKNSLKQKSLIAERDTAMAEALGVRRQAEEEREMHLTNVKALEEAFYSRQEELARESRELLAAAVADARRAATAETTAEGQSAAARERSEALAKQKAELQKAAEAAVRGKDRQMAKALKATARLAQKNQRETEAAIEAEKQRIVTDLRQQLQQSAEDARRSEEAQAVQVEELRGEVQRLQGEMEKRRSSHEAHLAEEKLRVEHAEASARAAAAKALSIEAEANRLRERLESVPRRLMQEHEEALIIREREMGEAIRKNAQADADAKAKQAEAAAKAELEAALAEQSSSLAVSHQAALRAVVSDVKATATSEKEAITAEARDTISTLEDRLRLAEGGLEQARREGLAARTDGTEALRKQMMVHEEVLRRAEEEKAVALAAVETGKREQLEEWQDNIRDSAERHRQDMDEAKKTFETEKRDLLAAAAIDKNQAMSALDASAVKEANDREERYRRDLDRLAESFGEEKKAALAEVLSKAEMERNKAVTTARVALLEEFKAEREALEIERREERTRMDEQEARNTRRYAHTKSQALEEALDKQRQQLERQARREREALEAAHVQEMSDVKAAREAERVKEREDERERVRRYAQDVSEAVKLAVEAEKERQGLSLKEALAESEAAAQLAVREATVRTVRSQDDKVVAAQHATDEERQKRCALEVAMKRAAKEWELERTNALKTQHREHQESLDAALRSLAAQRDQALQAAVDNERERATAEIQRATERAERKAQSAIEQSVAESEAVKKSASESVKAAEEGARLTQLRAQEERLQAEREVGREVGGARRALEEVRRSREEAEMAMEEGRARASKEMERLRKQSAALSETLRRTEAALAEEAKRAKVWSEEAEKLRRRSAVLVQEIKALRQQAIQRDQADGEGVEDMEWDEKLDAALREERQILERDFDERLKAILEDREREHSEVLRGALARSDAALGEVARVKKAMWKKAEENAQALTEAFEAAAARAAEEAELVTAEALARADSEYQEKISQLKTALAAKDGAIVGDGHSRQSEGQATESSNVLESSSGERDKEILRSALAAQKEEHARELEAALADRDAEALEALRLLHEQHTNAHNNNNADKYSGSSQNRVSPNQRSASRNHRNTTTRVVLHDANNTSSPHTALILDTPSIIFETSNTAAHKTPERSIGTSERGRRRRPRPPSAQNSLRQSEIQTPSAPIRRSRLGEAEDRAGVAVGGAGMMGDGFEAPSLRAASEMIEAAALARDEALREAREESDRLEEVLSSSPGGSSEHSDATQSPNTASQTAAAKLLLAPGWTVGEPQSSPSPSLGDNDSESNNSGRRRRPVGSTERNVGRRASMTGAGSDSLVLAVGDGNGLTVREERYKRELEGLRTRVRELGGMMENRLEERERMYRRKLRAAVAECRNLKVREQSTVNHGNGSSVDSRFNRDGKLSRSDLGRIPQEAPA